MAVATLDMFGLPNTPVMNSPALTTLSRSTPVSMPIPRSMYSTSSVATLPEAPLVVVKKKRRDISVNYK